MPKLLLADDSPTTQKVVQLTFADEGIEVVVADDGDTAMELYSHHRPDIVLADINIPGLNGYEVCEAIRKRDDNGSTPVILLAGSFEPFNVEEANRVGANDYLTKPFASIRRLVATVTALLDTAARHDASAEKTVEPNSVPPDPVEPEPAAHVEPSAQAENGVAPGPTLPPEPNPYATDDIEHLINQSFVETVEMPHTVAERVMSDIAAEKAEQQQRSEGSADPRDDAAFDDELIETTFANEPPVPVEQNADSQPQTQIVDGPAASLGEINSIEAETSANGNYETLSSEHRVEPLGEEFTPPDTNVSSSFLENVESNVDAGTSSLSQASTEEFQIDQSSDEAYFEPEAEPVEQSSVLESSLGTDNVPPTREHYQTEPSSQYQVEPTLVGESIIGSEQNELEPTIEQVMSSAEPETEPMADNAPPPTPWDSVAEPQSARYQLDESNLLELPAGFGSRSAEPRLEQESEVSNLASELAPEIIDEIARATASQISEELVREITKRIVPKVVEEVMARRRNENIE